MIPSEIMDQQRKHVENSSSGDYSSALFRARANESKTNVESLTTSVHDRSEPLPDCVHPEVLLRKATTINKEHIASSSNISAPVEQSSSQKSRQKPWSNNKQGDVLQQIAAEPAILSEIPDCTYCGAKRFEYEPPGFCCASREIHLLPTKMPRDLMLLYLGDSEEAAEFRKCVRSYNNMFAITSIGMHADELSCRRHHGVYTFTVHGQIYYFINQLVPLQGEKPKNLQLYFFNTDHETINRLSISSKFRDTLVAKFFETLKFNPYSAFFRSLQDVSDLDSYKIMLHSNLNVDQRTHKRFHKLHRQILKQMSRTHLNIFKCI
ncbi:hypothetical protein ACH5RR_021309 [Cinchona calisaya]|uniref:Helitron helicase-like domain-containing protein n=1 Tax=Cinchona calisaya TaxID=153742 RepID=A0ABD2ZGX8_9GENT